MEGNATLTNRQIIIQTQGLADKTSAMLPVGHAMWCWYRYVGGVWM